MPVLRRDDGVLFVLQPYRELLTTKSAALLKREVYLLSQQYGIYSRIYTQPNGQFEAVFARDSGCLLGEAIWQHFGKPQDLLYCEALPEKNQVVVVVVRNGYVYLDAKLSYSQLVEELAPLHAGSAHFAVYLHGDVPISETPANNTFSLALEKVKSFTRLDASVIETLVPAQHLNLLPIDQAITKLKLNHRTYQVMAAAAAVIVLSLGWIWFSATPNAPIMAQQTADPLQQYKQALTTPDPTVQLQQIAKQLRVAYSVPGWAPTRISYTGNSMQVELHSLGASITSLLQWSSTNNLNVALSTNGAVLTLPLAVAPRQVPAAIGSTQQMIATLIDRMMLIIPDKSVQLGTSVMGESFRSTTVSVTLNNVSPQVLSLIGKALVGLPLNVANNALDLNNGLLSGTLQLTLLGN
jgi:hypothetical protein